VGLPVRKLRSSAVCSSSRQHTQPTIILDHGNVNGWLRELFRYSIYCLRRTDVGQNRHGGWTAFVIAGAFSVVLEVLGIAVLKQFTEIMLKRYSARLPLIAIICGVMYVGNMILLTTLHEVLPLAWKPVSIGLLCFMPVVAYVSSGIQEAQDRESISHDVKALDEIRRQREIEDRNNAQEFEIKLIRERARIENRRSADRSKVVPPVVIPTEERTRGDDSGTILERIGQDGYTSAGALSRETGIPKTTVYRILSDLTEAGKLHRVDDSGKVSYSLNGYH